MKPAIKPSNTVHPIDIATGSPMPFQVRVGYGLTLVSQFISLRGEYTLVIKMDSIPLSVERNANKQKRPEGIIGISTFSVGPLCKLPHVMDIELTNIGPRPISGRVEFEFILEHYVEAKDKCLVGQIVG
jgi:hypothetical protein